MTDHSNTRAVGRFYDDHYDAFRSIYGDVIQAFRTIDISVLLDYEARAMELKLGMKVLDAGCGVCGPAVYFAEKYGVLVDAITASGTEAESATEKINTAGLSGQIVVRKGDYHRLEKFFTEESYDVVYFLESFGHSHDKKLAISSAWKILKPGGRLYIKDLFAKEAALRKHRAPIEENIRRINDSYCYHVGDLYQVLQQVRQRGFILSFLKTIDIPLEEFENLTISNEFQELTGINRIDDLKTYLFPVDFFELLCIKPWYKLSVGNSRYFLQNLYNLHIKGLSQYDL